MGKEPLDTAAEAMKYGELIFTNRNLTARNTELVAQNAGLEQSIAEHSAKLESEKIALNNVINEINEARQSLAAEEKRAKKDLSDYEKEVAKQNEAAIQIAQEAQARKDALDVQDVLLQDKAAELNAAQSKLEADQKELTIRAIELDDKEKQLNELAKETKRDLKAIRTETANNEKVKQEQEAEKQRLQELATAIQASAAAVELSLAQAAIDKEEARALNRSTQENIPTLKNLIAVLAEFQAFIINHSKNHDQIEAMFNTISKKLNIILNPVEDVA